MVNHRSTSIASRVRSFLSRLARNRAGNVLAITAAVIPPILVLVGGGIDMSRAYMTQAALQNACDAGVLAGRRAQAKSGSWSTTEQTKAQRMFGFNFQGTASSAAASSTVFTPTDTGSGVISGTATTTMPTTVMKMFGTNSFTLTANCSAEFQISNIDVMLVLDTTGSMACEPDGSNCSSGPDSKIEGLRTAIRSFYTTIATAVPAGGTTRVRFGFVPYSGTVNMRTLVAAGDIPSSYFTASTNYQTKIANFTEPNYIGTIGPETTVNVTSTQTSNNRCNNWANANDLVTGGPKPAETVTTDYAKVSYNSRTNQCTRAERTYTTTYTIGSYSLRDYTYKQSAVDTTTLRTLAAVPMVTAIASNATVQTSGSYDMFQLAALSGSTGLTVSDQTWAGCIEERSTVNTQFTNYTAPAGANDHNLTYAPTSDATRWHPYFGRMVFNRGQVAPRTTSGVITSTGEYCTPAAMRFTTVDTTAPNTVPSWLETYLGTLVARGNTYHDIGMVWGARLANPGGIMSTNVNAGNLSSVSRHIIMLTDGDMRPNNDVYNAYGMESMDARVAPAGTSDTDLITFHNARFLTACQTAKNMGYTIWFIAFGQSLTTEMESCVANGGGDALFADNPADLQSQFQDIASRIADLRLKT